MKRSWGINYYEFLVGFHHYVFPPIDREKKYNCYHKMSRNSAITKAYFTLSPNRYY